MTDAAILTKAAGSGSWARRNAFPLACIAPTVLVLFALTIFPLIYSIVISLLDVGRRDIGDPLGANWVGLDNFGDVLVDGRFWVAMGQTGIFMAATITVEFTVGLLLALFFFGEFKGRSAKSVYLPLILLPMMLAPVVVGYMWRLLYQVEFGPFNYMLGEFFGIGPLKWTAGPETSLMSVIIADIWQWTPFVTLVLLAGIVSLPQELFEVADMDGANMWRKLRYIILPMLRRVIAIVLLIRTLDAFRELDKIWVMTQGGPGTSTETSSLYAYLSGFKYFRIGYATAMSILLMILTVVICTLIARIFHTEQEGT